MGRYGAQKQWLCSRFHFSRPQSVLKKRDHVQAEYEAKLEAVALRKEERPKVRGPPGGGRAVTPHGCAGWIHVP